MTTAKINSIKDTQIDLDISGQLITITNSLSSLQSALAQQNVQRLQSADTIYNIGTINNASFDMIQGRKVFNFELIKTIIDTLSLHSKDINTFRKAALSHSPAWERVDQVRRVALGHIENSFIGLIRIQLRKLFAIGLEPMSEVKLEKYIGQCHQLTNAVIRLFNFILIKTLCDPSLKLSKKLTLSEKQTIDSFYNTFFERSAAENYDTLKGLIAICKSYKIIPVMDELMDFVDPDIDLTIGELDKLKLRDTNPIGNSALYSFTDCSFAEECVMNFFKKLGFLINYKMVVINGVAYEEAYQQKQFYVHKYSLLETDSSPKTNKISYEADPIPSNAVMIYKGDYRRGINLFPFIIDLNSITEEGYPKLYIFLHMGNIPDMLTYEFIEGEQIYQILGSGRRRSIKDLNEEMTDADKRKLYRHDRIYEVFRDDKKALT